MAKPCILAALLAVACITTTVSSAVLLSPVATTEVGTWTNLFRPPYNSGPSIITGLSCNTQSSCYIPGGSMGTNFDIFSFPGVANGTFTPLKMPNPPGVIVAIAVGGPSNAIGGAVIGSGGGANVGVQYPSDNVTFLPSNTLEMFAMSQDVRTSVYDGQEVLVVNSGPNAVMFSSNGGKDFNIRHINVKLANNCTTSRYGAMVDKDTWYVTMGSWPSQGEGQLSRRASVSRCPKTGKVVRKTRKFGVTAASQQLGSNTPSCNVYSAQIVKTTDGGNTWTTQFSEASNFLFNAIECLTTLNCVAVGEGDSGVYIYRTTDGQTWNQVLAKPFSSNLRYSFATVRVNEQGHFFAVGGKETPTSGMSYMLTSVDRGATWVEVNSLPNIVDISSLSFTPGGYGFATAETNYSTTTILRYDPAPSSSLR